jgi:cadmium resistance transport/sequestration family protein
MELFLTSIIAFASTNIDDIFLLMLFFGDKRFSVVDIYLGQYLGIIVLVAVSVAASLIGNFIDSKYIGLLGLFPLYLGVRQIISLLKAGHTEEEPIRADKYTKVGILAVATVTVANGGDNIGTYIPLFASLTTAGKSVMIGIFLLMVFIWVTLARYLRNHPVLATSISKYGHIITPIVLCLLGVYILIENGSVALLK